MFLNASSSNSYRDIKLNRSVISTPLCRTDMPVPGQPSPGSPVTTWILVVPCLPWSSHITAETSHHRQPTAKSGTRYLANYSPAPPWEQKLPTKMVGYTGHRKVLSLARSILSLTIFMLSMIQGHFLGHAPVSFNRTGM